MNEWLSLSDGGWWNVAGWTMLHFLWLGTLVGLAAGVCRLLMRHASASLRYAAALACFVALAALPIGIGAWLVANQITPQTFVSLNNATLATPPAPGSAGGISGNASADSPTPPTPIRVRESATEAQSNSNPRPTRKPGTPRGLTDVLAFMAGYLPWAWLTGTPLTFLLLVTGVIGAERLRRSSRILDDGPIAEACAELVKSLRIGSRVTVAVCERIAAPVLVGIARPMILLPSAALTGWSPEEIEMVLLHELAHVRRWDNLVNLLQRFVEAALFFHPAVWLVSRWVRAEREACCDAMVVGRTQRPHDYAEMLVALAAQLPRSVLFHPAATSAMAAGPLRCRIHRILALDADPMLVSGKSLGVVMSGLLLAATLVVLNLPTSTQADEERAAKSISAADPTLVDVPYEVGATKFETGDEIKITLIRGTSENFKPRHEYWIKGTYTLRSRDRASLGASVTAQSSASAIPQPHDPDQSLEIKRGSGEFTLKLPMHRDGWPHVSFYPADGGQSFGGVYFGTGESVLKEWWKESPRLNSDDDSLVETEAVRQELNRQAAAKNQLKDLALALMNYHDAKGTFPANASYDTFDRPLLSWRVHILPYLDGNAAGEGTAADLYKEFHLDEPWDSEHNRALIPRMPAVFQNPNRPTGPFTSYVAAVGSDCVFDGTAKGTSFAQIPDGTSNTIMLVEADAAVEWTRPADLKFNPAMPKIGLGDLRPNGWLAVFADGSVHLIDKDKSAREVRDLFTCGRRQPGSVEIKLPDLNQSVREGADEFRAKFVPTDDNPLETHVYAINNAPNAILRLEWTTKMLERKPGAPKVVFGYNWRDGFTHLEIITPKAAQEFLKPQILASQTTSNAPAESATFPSLEEQRLADTAYRRLGLELEAIADEDLKRVKALGYEGGLRVTANENNIFPMGSVESGDILVGLHVWPTRSMQELLEILERDDLAELNPLKYYVVHGNQREAYLNPQYEVITGRVDVPLQRNSAGRTEPPPVYGLVDPVSQQPQPVTAEAQPIQPQPVTVEAQPDVNRVDPLPAEAVRSLREHGPIVVEVFYQDRSEPCREMLDALKVFQRANLNVPVEIIRRNAEVELASLAKYNIDRTPFFVVSKEGKQLDGVYGPLTANEISNRLFKVAVNLSGTTAEQPTLRYNGKTFEEWRTAWQTELSLEKRLEVVKALAAFGASGRGKEAAEAILDVAEQLDWSYIHDAAKGRLQQACIDAFTSGEATDGYRIPSDAWFPLIVPIVEKSGNEFTFASYLVNQLSPGEKNLVPRLIELTKNSNTRNWAIQALKAVDPKLEDERVLKCFRDALGQKGQTAADVQMLIYCLSYPQNPGGGRDRNITLRFVPELEPFLFDPDEGTRRKARLAISWIQPADARELVKRLNARLDDESDKDRTEVFRALAAIGPQALPAESKLEQAATSTSDPNRYSAGVALERIRDNQDNASMNLGIDLQTTPFEPHRRQLEAERRELFPDGIYPPNDPMLGGGGGFF